jgi:parallel beta-helix repeat protein
MEPINKYIAGTPPLESGVKKYTHDEFLKVERSFGSFLDLFGLILYPITQEEIDEGLNNNDLNRRYREGDIRRYKATEADASPALQIAIEVMERHGGGQVYIPAGTWGITAAHSMRDGVWVIGEGYGSHLRLIDGASFTNNIIKFETITGAGVQNIRLDGNRANTGGGTRYGIYFGSATKCAVLHCYVHSFIGDAIHLYSSDNATCIGNYAWDNGFHGIELEQLRDSVCNSNVSVSNDIHGIYIFEGEVSASGSKRLVVNGNTCDHNTQSGIVVQGSLTEDVTITANNCSYNEERGIMFFDRCRGIVCNGNIISYNGQFGIYMYRITNSIITSNRLLNNSTSSNGGYSEILWEGDATQYSMYNLFEGNTVLIDSGGNKSAYGMKEGSINDGPNIVRGNNVPLSGTAGTIAVLHETGANSSFSLCRGNIGRVDENGGLASFNGNFGAGTFFFDIAHGLTTDEPRKYSVTPASDAAGTNGTGGGDASFYCTSDATNIRVIFKNYIPPTGTNNVAFRWKAEH